MRDVGGCWLKHEATELANPFDWLDSDIDSGVPMVALEIAEMGNQCTACHLAVPLFFAEDGDYIVSRWRAVQAFAFRTIFSL